MNQLLLQRLESSPHGTFGRLVVGNKIFVTGELPWRGNTPFISCIPSGVYIVYWTFSRRFSGYTYELMHVKGREGIRIHSANLVGDREKGFRSQVDGCIAIGLTMGDIRGQRAILQSREAVSQFELVMGKEAFALEIKGGTNTIVL